MLINDIPNLTDSERFEASAFRHGCLGALIEDASAKLRRVVALNDLDHATSVLLSGIVNDLRAATSAAEKLASDHILRLRKSNPSAAHASEHEAFR